MKSSTSLDDLLKYSLQDICRATGESLPTVYAACKAGHLKTFIVGRRRFAKREAVMAWIDYLERQSARGKPVRYHSATDAPPMDKTIIDNTNQAAGLRGRKALHDKTRREREKEAA